MLRLGEGEADEPAHRVADPEGLGGPADLQRLGEDGGGIGEDVAIKVDVADGSGGRRAPRIALAAQIADEDLIAVSAEVAGQRVLAGEHHVESIDREPVAEDEGKSARGGVCWLEVGDRQLPPVRCSGCQQVVRIQPRAIHLAPDREVERQQDCDAHRHK